MLRIDYNTHSTAVGPTGMQPFLTKGRYSNAHAAQRIYNPRRRGSLHPVAQKLVAELGVPTVHDGGAHLGAQPQHVRNVVHGQQRASKRVAHRVLEHDVHGRARVARAARAVAAVLHRGKVAGVDGLMQVDRPFARERRAKPRRARGIYAIYTRARALDGTRNRRTKHVHAQRGAHDQVERVAHAHQITRLVAR